MATHYNAIGLCVRVCVCSSMGYDRSNAVAVDALRTAALAALYEMDMETPVVHDVVASTQPVRVYPCSYRRPVFHPGSALLIRLLITGRMSRKAAVCHYG